MTSTPSDSGEFSLVVVEVDAAMTEEAADSLAEAFHLDSSVAQQVLKSAPIVFARGLTKHEVKSITPKLIDLSKMGIEFRVTVRSTGKLPKLNWPVRPQFTAGGSGGPSVTPAFEWADSAFVCPSCGEAFLFKRLGNLPLGPTPSEGEAQVGESNEPSMYNVVLPGIADPAKAEKAAELIARYQNISMDEARGLTSNTLIAVARNVSRTDAQLILEEFKRHRLFGRMSRS